MSSVLRRLLAGLLALEIAGIVWLVLNPSAATPSSAVQSLSEVVAALGLPPLLAQPTFVEFYLNVQLFVPLTILCALLWDRVKVWVWIALGFLLSSTLEWLQLEFLSDRSSTSRDIIANTLGAAVGAVTVFVIRWLAELRPAAAERRATELRRAQSR